MLPATKVSPCCEPLGAVAGSGVIGRSARRCPLGGLGTLSAGATALAPFCATGVAQADPFSWSSPNEVAGAVGSAIGVSRPSYLQCTAVDPANGYEKTFNPRTRRLVALAHSVEQPRRDDRARVSDGRRSARRSTRRAAR
jgi:hypothetical protein